MENAPEAAAAAPQAPETEATPTTNPEPAQAPDMHGFTSEQLAEMKKFYDANGGFEKVKSRLSNPEPKTESVTVKDTAPQFEQSAEAPSHPQQFKTPEGAITAQEFLAKQYFQSLSGEEKYAAISKEIANGDLLAEMKAFNIRTFNDDGSINDQMVRRYLDLKAQTVPAKATSSEPNMSNAPTVDYVEVGDKITDINQAYAVLQQDAKLKAMGQAGHPQISMAEDFIKNQLNPEKKK